MRFTVIVLAVLASVVTAKVEDQKILRKVEVSSKAAAQYAKAQSCAKKGTLILEGMKMEKVKYENLLDMAADQGAEAVKKAKKHDALMKMAMRSFEAQYEKYQAHIGNLRTQLENEETQKQTEMLDMEAERDYEDFKNKFELHSSSMVEQESNVQQAEVSSEAMKKQMEQTEAAQEEVESIRKEADDLLQELATKDEITSLLEKRVQTLKDQVNSGLVQQKVQEQEKVVDRANEMSENAQTAKTMVISAAIDELVDDAIMDFLLNPPAHIISGKPALIETDDSTSDPKFMLHPIVKLKLKQETESPVLAGAVVPPGLETQQVLYDRVLKDLTEQSKISIASVDLDAYKNDAKVQMHMLCLKSMMDQIYGDNVKLFLDVHGGSRQRRDRVKSMAKQYLQKAQPLDKIKNYQAEEFTYKLADSIFKIGAHDGLESEAKLMEMKRGSDVYADVSKPKEQMCSMSGEMGNELIKMQEAAAEAQKKPSNLEGILKNQQDAINAAFAHKPYFGHTESFQQQPGKAMKQLKALKAEPVNQENKPEGLAPSQRRAFTA